MKRLNANQWTAISSLILLGPALRLLPQLTAAAAGRAAWLSVLPALPLLLFYAGLFSRWLEKRQARTGLPELLLQALGEKPGKALLLLLSLWLCFYGGFLLRSGADRLVVTVYPHSGPTVFALSMGLACALAALMAAPAQAQQPSREQLEAAIAQMPKLPNSEKVQELLRFFGCADGVETGALPPCHYNDMIGHSLSFVLLIYAVFC